MPFNSLEYLLFFIFVLFFSWLLLGKPRLRIYFLLIASYYFYASHNGWILTLLLASTAVDYFAGIAIEDSSSATKRKTYLTVSLITNLGMLGFFKYFNFFMDSASAVGLAGSWNSLDILLPVGISFYTFQSMSHTIDVYYGALKTERSMLRFAFFVSFFPQLVAGPIVRARYFLHQIPEQPRLTRQALEGSLYLIFTGLFKKIVLGDSLGDYADIAFADPSGVGAITAWLGLYAFAFQIYFDFSGYTDIAVGCARLMGYKLPPNFRRPYTSRSFSEFWRRWHISLSSWLRDYLYKPLGGNRVSPVATYRNLLVTMLLGGLWHGAAWTFVVWGAAHGLLLAVERYFGFAALTRDYRKQPFRRFMRSMVVSNVLILTWLPFRATDFSNMSDFAKALFRFDEPVTITTGMLAAASVIVLGWAMQWVGELVSIKRMILKQPFLIRAGFYAAVIVMVLVFGSRGTEAFIYFRF